MDDIDENTIDSFEADDNGVKPRHTSGVAPPLSNSGRVCIARLLYVNTVLASMPFYCS